MIPYPIFHTGPLSDLETDRGILSYGMSIIIEGDRIGCFCQHHPARDTDRLQQHSEDCHKRKKPVRLFPHKVTSHIYFAIIYPARTLLIFITEQIHFLYHRMA